ncbi:MAG: HEPN domain-containing protein [Gammaproteobacteria bacterium]|nr:HEPN domain-containing protein [Gammaproteobacteria bacterium]
MQTDELLKKSQRALQSAQLLLAEEDCDGACNRAYYAMFDAAKAALMVQGYSEIAMTTKTHNGLITAFSLHLIKTGVLARELGQSFNRIEEVRLVADYLGSVIDRELAVRAVDEAGQFISVIMCQLFQEENR